MMKHTRNVETARVGRNLAHVVALTAAMLIGPMALQSQAGNVLVLTPGGDRSADGDNLVNTLNSQGNTATRVDSLPANLSSVDTIWHVGAFTPLSALIQNQLASFLGSGGGVHLTGERPCCESLNDSLESLINSVVVGGGITVGDQGDQGSDATFNPNAVGGVTTSPNILTSWSPSASGGMDGLGGLASPSNILATSDSTNGAVGGVWDSSDLVGGVGRLTILMDVNWFSTFTQDNTNAIENIQIYLEGGTTQVVPEPSTMAMGIIACAMTGLIYGRRRLKQAA